MSEDALPVPSVLPDSNQRKLRRACWLLVLLLLFATAYHWHPGGGWNVMTRLALIRAIVHDQLHRRGLDLGQSLERRVQC